MVKFGFKDYQDNYPNWSKHHKTIGIQVKRVYGDGTVILTENEKLNAIVAENEHLLNTKRVMLFDRKASERKHAIDYYLPLTNLEYEEANLEYYSVGAMNTSQTTHVRLTFLLDYDRFILDYSFKSEGSGAMSFYHLMDGVDFVESIIDEVLEENKFLEEVGITKGEDRQEDFHIVLVSHIGEIMDVDVERQELLDSLVGVEIYRFDQKID